MATRKETGEPPVEEGWAAWKPVSTIMRTGIPKVAPDCARTTLATLFQARPASEAIVVDGDGKPMGIIDRAAIEKGTGQTAAELMVAAVFTLNESIPLSLAAALMASARVDRVPIVSSTSETVGLLTCRELLVWIARQAGHRVVEAGVTAIRKP